MRLLIGVTLLVACSGGTPPGTQKAGSTGSLGEQQSGSSSRLSPPKKSPKETTEVLFDFHANEPLSHREMKGNLLIHAEDVGFAKYADWAIFSSRVPKLHEKEGALGVPINKRFRLRFPMLQQQENRVALHLYSSREQRLVVTLNDKKVYTGELKKGWQWIVIEPHPFRKGENEIGLEGVRRGTAFFRSASVRGQPDEVGGMVKGKVSGDEGRAWYLQLSKDTKIYLDRKDCAADVLLEGGKEPQSLVVTGGALTTVPVSGPHKLTVTAGTCKIIDLQELTLRKAKTQKPEKFTPPKHIVFWIMDTLRADRLRPFEPSARPEVPTLAALAKNGVVFRQAWVEGNESQTSHASMWTGQFPAVHGIRSAGNNLEWKISSKTPVLGELMKNAGFQTYGLTANGMVVPHAGYGRGFDKYINKMREKDAKRMNGYIPSNKMLKYADKLLAGVFEKGPTFFFMGTIDTHKPWVGHEPWLSKYDPTPYRGPFRRSAPPRLLGLTKGSMRCVTDLKPRDLQRIHAIYDSDVSFQDQKFGEFLQTLKDKGVYDDTLVVLTSDHGEELWEDGRCGHGASLREDLTNVPLLFHYPKELPKGVVIEEGVDGVDILPTLLELLGQEIPGTVQGESLLGLMFGQGTGFPRASYASQYEYAHAMRIGPWKARVSRKGLQIYNLELDPDEHHSIPAENPIATRTVLDAMGVFLAYRSHWKKANWGTANNLRKDAPVQMAQLRR